MKETKFKTTEFKTTEGKPLFDKGKWKCHICGAKILTDLNEGYSCYINYCINCDKRFIIKNG